MHKSPYQKQETEKRMLQAQMLSRVTMLDDILNTENKKLIK